MKNRDFLTYFSKKIKEHMPNAVIKDSQASNLNVGDFYIEIMSADRDNKLTNKYIQRFMQDTSIRVIYYTGKRPDTEKMNEVQDMLLDIMQWVELDGRVTRARDVQCTFSMNKDANCLVCVAKYYNLLVRDLTTNEDLMLNKVNVNFVEEED